jgi:hypothetical protein
MSKAHEPYITVSHGIGGHFAVLMLRNPDGFFEPWVTGGTYYPTRDGAVEEAKVWAEAEELALQV